MHLTIANVSKTIPTADFQAAVRAIARQVKEDFAPEWDITATLSGVTTNLKDGKLAPVEGRRSAIIYVGDSTEDPTTGVTGALGYHADNHRNVPYGFIYLDICKEAGENWTITLSHEVLELLGDPTAATTISGPAPHGHTHSGAVYYDLEVCDPTQGDSYVIDNVHVSNFVGKAYFKLAGGTGKTNFLDLDLKPFGVRPMGYFQFEDNTGGHQVEGQDVARALALKKTRMAKVRRNSRREAFLGQP